MRYFALATDYDGTIAHHGIVDEPTLSALHRLKASGRHLILVTGRRLEDLLATFPEIDLFEIAVLENGALLYWPSTQADKLIAESVPRTFADELTRRGVVPDVGRSIVATWEPHQQVVLDTIHDLGLELQIIFNKDAVMVLPAGVNKASGLDAALGELGLSWHNVVGIGDAENDHAFLSRCEFSVAVENALPALKERADLVTEGDHGAGAAELIDRILDNDLRDASEKLERRNILLGTREDSARVTLPPYGVNVLVTGTEGGGKSTLTTGAMERLIEAGYQVLAIDPEGDYQKLGDALVLGDPTKTATPEEIMAVLSDPSHSVIVNLLGTPTAERPQYFQSLFARLLELRMQFGRPHWIVLDEAHHLLPADWQPAGLTMPQTFDGLLMITLATEHLLPAALALVDDVIAVGKTPAETIRRFCHSVGQTPPHVEGGDLEKGEALFWSRRNGHPPFRFRVAPCETEQVRHRRKYAEAELTPDRSFFFRGPEEKLNLRAQNLMMFLQLMDGVDDETWLHHLRKGEYSEWFRENIKNEDLAKDAERTEREAADSAEESRNQIRRAIEDRYTAPA
jgi:hydroxymethylpyrimidine pyrophosphatase-like HAD family hydrolase